MLSYFLRIWCSDSLPIIIRSNQVRHHKIAYTCVASRVPQSWRMENTLGQNSILQDSGCEVYGEQRGNVFGEILSYNIVPMSAKQNVFRSSVQIRSTGYLPPQLINAS